MDGAASEEGEVVIDLRSTSASRWKPTTPLKRKPLSCLRCAYVWVPRIHNPKACPNCLSRKWMVARAQLERGAQQARCVTT